MPDAPKMKMSTIVDAVREAGAADNATFKSELLSDVAKTVGDAVTAAVAAKDVAAPAIKTNYGDRISGTVKREKISDQKGLNFARTLRALAIGKGNPDAAMQFAKQAWDEDTANAVCKTMTAGDFEGGGFLVPEEVSSEVIELLRARAAVRRAGPLIVELNGSLTLPKLTQGATAVWKGEAKAKNASKIKGGQVKLTPHILETKVLISERLQRQSPASADALVRRDMIAAMRNAEDTEFLRGVGSENMPKGMINFAVGANKFAANGTVNLANVRTDLRKLFDRLTSGNVPMENPAFFMSHRTRNFLMWDLVDNEGRLVFQEQLSRTEGGSDGILNGVPVYATNNIPDNLGGGNDASEVILAEMSDIILGQGPNLRVKVSSEASITDDTGTLVSAFELGLTVILIESELDLNTRHAESIAALTAVKWTS